MKKLVIIACFSPFLVTAQPSDTEIKKQLTNPNTIEIKFTKTTGTRQWNSSTGNWEYVRGVIMKQKSFEYPEYKVTIGGDAVYQQTAGGKYSYWKFRSLYQFFEGIPNPSAADIQGVIEKDWKKFYGHRFAKIVKLHTLPQLAAEPAWMWHTPKSVSFKMSYTIDIITSNIHLETRNENCEIRFYRDELKGEWKNFIVSNAAGETVTKKELTPEEIKQLEKNTLAYSLNEQQAQQAAGNLPSVAVPDFKNPQEMADFIHSILLNGNPGQLKAVLLQTLAPAVFFVPGSAVQLNPNGNNLVNKCIKAAFLGPLKYKDQYCENYKKGSMTAAQHIYILGNMPKTTTMISFTNVNEGYINGVPQTRWKISNLDITVRQDEDAVQYLKSFSDKSKLCTNE